MFWVCLAFEYLEGVGYMKDFMEICAIALGRIKLELMVNYMFGGMVG